MINYKLYFAVLFCVFTFGKTINPTEITKSEILEIKGKTREYFSASSNLLQYKVAGPRFFRLISRCAVPQDLNLDVNYSFEIKIDNEYKFATSHSTNIFEKIQSNQHPGYGYTISRNDIIYVPNGDHTVSLIPTDNKNPILFRMITHNLNQRKEESEVIIGFNEQIIHHLKVGNSSLPYTLLDSENKFEFEIEGKGFVDIISRLVIENDNSENGVYSIVVQKDGKEYRTYHLQTETSNQSTIIENSDIIPGKWRTSQIKVPTGKHHYTIRCLNDNQSIYIRCLQH
ncbi:MAG: hypothetical protein ISR90_03940 [Candidatus Marinimicrobia bacterium]|nr:hypothetical protein [Candidatus Neomarinimicrobiota bacterium]MBL7023191.1 hypothetical protein [Candidatus Neomarinimicrobiota bacterium]MBL7109246.1 hypothetical protein [Candidatus Neomarinimicrobiota bacterium]